LFVATNLLAASSQRRYAINARVFTSGARDLACKRNAGWHTRDPSFRLKNGSARDDATLSLAFTKIQTEPLPNGVQQSQADNLSDNHCEHDVSRKNVWFFAV
jgi:hypothetical protein